MPITEHQLELRKKHVGSSDTAAIMGINPFKSAYDVWLEKTGQLQETEAPPESESMGIGKMIENSLLDWGFLELPDTVRGGAGMVKNQYRVHEGGILSATHDALLSGAPVGLEAKTSGILSPSAARDQWGEPWTDAVPDHVIIQCQHQMIVSRLETVFVPALLGGRGRVMFKVVNSPDLADAILFKVEAFWVKCVQAGTPPDNSMPTVEVARLRKRVEGKSIPLADELVQAWKEEREALKLQEEKLRNAEAAIMAALGDAEIGTASDCRVKMISGKSSWLDAKALAAEVPDVAAKFTRTKDYRYPKVVKL